MSAHVLLKLLRMGKTIKMQGLPSIFFCYFATILIISIVQDQEYYILFITWYFFNPLLHRLFIEHIIF